MKAIMQFEVSLTNRFANKVAVVTGGSSGIAQSHGTRVCPGGSQGRDCCSKTAAGARHYERN